MAEPDTQCGECLNGHGVGRYEFVWLAEPTRKTTNVNGTTGFAKLLKSSSATNPAGSTCRIHLCAHHPCTALWPANKHKILYGPPMHLQPIVETAVVETGAAVVETRVAETAVAETTATAVAETAVAVAGTAVAGTTATAVAETTVVDTTEKGSHA